jgi:hypothetical protein
MHYGCLYHPDYQRSTEVDDTTVLEITYDGKHYTAKHGPVGWVVRHCGSRIGYIEPSHRVGWMVYTADGTRLNFDVEGVWEAVETILFHDTGEDED